MQIASALRQLLFPAWRDALPSDVGKCCRMKNNDDNWLAGRIVMAMSNGTFLCSHVTAGMCRVLETTQSEYFTTCQVRV